jgi:hypothetical protein
MSETTPHDDDPGDYYADEPECCWACHGEGFFHDCGEDTCCCLRPERDYCYPCEECGGTGELR